jgi:hypothetical protein
MRRRASSSGTILSRGMLTENEPAPAKQDELQMRTFWRRWKELMSASEQVAA